MRLSRRSSTINFNNKRNIEREMKECAMMRHRAIKISLHFFSKILSKLFFKLFQDDRDLLEPGSTKINKTRASSPIAHTDRNKTPSNFKFSHSAHFDYELN